MSKIKNKWIITDPSCNQVMKQINEKEFKFKEDRIINPSTGEIEVYEEEIDLDDYSIEFMRSVLITYGYENELDHWIKTRTNFALIAECIFEQSTENNYA